uniref:Uncharacterized protein n=1 Tax=Oryzias latipes TaxID=8090 RepID=A0A3P9JG01_ORYLA
MKPLKIILYPPVPTVPKTALASKQFYFPCNVVCEHKQKSTINAHLSTVKHTRRLAETCVQVCSWAEFTMCGFERNYPNNFTFCALRIIKNAHNIPKGLEYASSIGLISI